MTRDEGMETFAGEECFLFLFLERMNPKQQQMFLSLPLFSVVSTSLFLSPKRGICFMRERGVEGVLYENMIS